MAPHCISCRLPPPDDRRAHWPWQDRWTTVLWFPSPRHDVSCPFSVLRPVAPRVADHFIGENAVGRRIVAETCCTMGPFFSLSANTRARSGSLANVSNFVTRSFRSSQASM
jgi:hypothetical protein